MLTRDDLMNIVVEALRANGGRADVVAVSRYIWQKYEEQLRESENLLYTWQYDVRWAAHKLRGTGVLKQMHNDRRKPWELATKYLSDTAVLPSKKTKVFAGRSRRPT